MGRMLPRKWGCILRHIYLCLVSWLPAVIFNSVVSSPVGWVSSINSDEHSKLANRRLLGSRLGTAVYFDEVTRLRETICTNWNWPNYVKWFSLSAVVFDPKLEMLRSEPPLHTYVYVRDRSVDGSFQLCQIHLLTEFRETPKIKRLHAVSLIVSLIANKIENYSHRNLKLFPRWKIKALRI